MFQVGLDFTEAIVPNWCSTITATKIYFIPLKKTHVNYFLWCPDGAKVKQDGCHSISPRAGTRAVSMAGHLETRQAHAARVWENSATYFCLSQKIKQTDQWYLLNCQHLKRTTKADFSEIHNVPEVAVRCPRKSPFLEGRNLRFQPSLHLLHWVCVKMSNLWGEKNSTIMYSARLPNISEFCP